MTIPEASRLVIQAGALATGGEVFVLDMGDPVKIDDLARDLIRLSGLEPDVDTKIEYTGLRPGEKLYEELLMDEEGLQKTSHSKIFIGKQMGITFQEVIMCVKALESSMGSNQEIKECMARLVPTYRYVPDLQQAVGETYQDTRIEHKLEPVKFKEHKRLKYAARN
jgi:FlaA1/EpsC-like NDP-sugar epimerase